LKIIQKDLSFSKYKIIYKKIQIFSYLK